VTITGQRLGATKAVMFGRVSGTNLHVVSDNSLTIIAPKHRPGALDVRVINRFGPTPRTAADRFHFAGTPTITGVSPGSGPNDGGTEVTITGTHLATVTNVLFGGAPADLVQASPTSLTVVTPAHQHGQVDVVASGPGGTSPTGPAAVFVYR
jgi:hypothetical protein